jgi:hypothetical protein
LLPRSTLWTSWALYFQLQLCATCVHAGEAAAAAECVRSGRAMADELGDAHAQARTRTRVALAPRLFAV